MRLTFDVYIFKSHGSLVTLIHLAAISVSFSLRLVVPIKAMGKVKNSVRSKNQSGIEDFFKRTKSGNSAIKKKSVNNNRSLAPNEFYKLCLEEQLVEKNLLNQVNSDAESGLSPDISNSHEITTDERILIDELSDSSVILSNIAFEHNYSKPVITCLNQSCHDEVKII